MGAAMPVRAVAAAVAAHGVAAVADGGADFNTG